MGTPCSVAAVACRGFGRRFTWETLACTRRFDPNILRAALPQNVDWQDAEGDTN